MYHVLLRMYSVCMFHRVLRHRLKDVLYMALPFKGDKVSSVRAPSMYQRFSYFAIAFCKRRPMPGALWLTPSSFQVTFAGVCGYRCSLELRTHIPL